MKINMFIAQSHAVNVTEPAIVGRKKIMHAFDVRPDSILLYTNWTKLRYKALCIVEFIQFVCWCKIAAAATHTYTQTSWNEDIAATSLTTAKVTITIATARAIIKYYESGWSNKRATTK